MAINDVPVWYFENTDLILFIAKQSKNIVTPFRITPLCADFKSIKKTNLSVFCLCRRIERFRHKLHELTDLDIITRMKMLFALSAPVDKNFLKELSKEAVVEVDEQNRIVSFESKDLKLKGTHFSSLNRDKLNKDKQILHFLFEFSKTIDSPVSGSSFVRSYAKATSSTATTYLRDRYAALTSQIHSCTAYDAASKAKMMFVSSTAVSEDFLKELRKDAIVEIDKENRITHYEANDGNIKFKGSHRRLWPKKSCATVKTNVPAVMRNIGHPDVAIHSKKTSPSAVQTFVSSANINITGGRKLVIQDAPSINFSSTMNVLFHRRIKRDVVEEDRHKDNSKNSKRRILNVDVEKEQIKRCRKLTKRSEENVPETDTKHTPDLSSSVSYEHLRRAIFENVDEMPETQRTIATRHKIKKDKIEEVNALEVLRDVVNALNSPRLVKVHKLILKRGRNQRNIVNHTSEVNMGLRTAFLALIKNAKPYKISEKFVSLRKVLVLLCCNLINMNCPSLSGFQKEITTTIRDLRTVDKSISFKTLSMILKTVVLALSSREDEDE
ncbi:Protein CBG00440 [Caenorhabditis briggsae]|uniref:Protein CBG00440 n=2 Tax=Caenorhabditis briggsae TaxID=6238 RepID=A8WN36_CAEBR|nr:Protein CBG00440 [Caenorhabditis briggsae]ULT92921.1 hypothetical protein L3Y34_002834 [Caenorhabditis briggsae]CAP21891.2 Protein CBG00440 [Caenorhabditis briggsae]